MGLRLYNTLTRTKQDFDPIDPVNVRMYVCGPTVYDFAHIGNARPLIVFDVLFRLLKHLAERGEWDGGKGQTNVTYVRNITDVDDKINARAAEEYSNLPLNEAIRQVTTKTENQFHEDVAALGCLEPTVEPRATEHIDEMKAMIEQLVANDFAYVAEDHVYFRVAAMADYGRLSNRSLDEMIAGARVEIAGAKADAADFVLWKPSKPGEPAWPSPSGIPTTGRPGWHLECSAMSDKYLWEDAKANLSEAGRARPHQFDIHGGGIDLVFPHHENEIAQSRCAHGTPAMANIWMHNGFLQVEGEKMSKSLGNFVTIAELLETEKFGGRSWSGDVLRLAMLKTHYRQPIDWTVRRLQEAEDQLVQWSFVYDDIAEPLNDTQLAFAGASPDALVLSALDDDLNTHLAVTHLIRLAGEASADPSVLPTFLASLGVLGLKPLRPGRLDSKNESQRDTIEKATVLVAARATARNAKDFSEADRIRDELDAMGIQLKDSKDPDTGELVTTWEVKR